MDIRSNKEFILLSNFQKRRYSEESPIDNTSMIIHYTEIKYLTQFRNRINLSRPSEFGANDYIDFENTEDAQTAYMAIWEKLNNIFKED